MDAFNTQSYQQVPQPTWAQGTPSYIPPSTPTPRIQPQPQQFAQQPIMYPPKVCDFVQGDIGATIFNVVYNQEATLIDMDNDEFVFRKKRDGNGNVTLKKYRLVPVEEDTKTQIDLSGYVKSEDILDLITETVATEVDKKLKSMSFKPTSKED